MAIERSAGTRKCSLIRLSAMISCHSPWSDIADSRKRIQFGADAGSFTFLPRAVAKFSMEVSHVR
jgi:hypothetical protein